MSFEVLKVSIGKIGRRKQYDGYQAKLQKLGVPNLIALDLGRADY